MKSQSSASLKSYSLCGHHGSPPLEEQLRGLGPGKGTWKGTWKGALERGPPIACWVYATSIPQRATMQSSLGSEGTLVSSL